jgi:hypothetical protein
LKGVPLSKRMKRKDIDLLIELIEQLLEIIQLSSFVSVGFLGI